MVNKQLFDSLRKHDNIHYDTDDGDGLSIVKICENAVTPETFTKCLEYLGLSLNI